MSELIPEGHYKARGVEGSLAETKAGKPQAAVIVEILEDGPWAGHKLTWYGSFSEKAARRTIESLRLLGWDGDELSNLDGIDRNEVSVDVQHETDDETGKVRVRAAWINRPGPAIKALDPLKAKAFSASMKGLIKSVPKSGGAAPASAPRQPAPRQPAAAISDEEPPF